MKVQELRIGNWVNNRMGHDMQIRDVEDLQDHESHDCFIPIPLTAEWLKRFGFRNEKTQLLDLWILDVPVFKQELKQIIVDLNQGIGLRQGSLDQERFNDDLISLHNIDMQGPIFIHKLQNTAFILSGEELTLKEQ